MEGDVVLGHADLLRNLNNLNLDIDLNKMFTERVDLDKTRVNSAIESTEFGDQTNVTLRDRFVGVRTADAAGEGAHISNT